MTKQILGHIDCPSCGTVKGMRITHDKNGHPFGFCEAKCGQQLRVGGDQRRVDAFTKRHPWAGANPVTVTDTGTPAAPEPAAEPAAPAVPEPKPKRAAWFQPILASGGQ